MDGSSPIESKLTQVCKERLFSKFNSMQSSQSSPSCYLFSVQLNSVQSCYKCWYNWKNMWSSLFVWDKQKDKQTNKGWSKIIGESEILCVLVTPCLLVSQKITNNSQFISSTFTDWFLSRIWFIFRQLHDIHASLWYILANSWNKIRRGVQFSKLCSTIAKDVDIFGIYFRISRFDTNPQIIWW